MTKLFYSYLRFWRSDIEGGILNRELSFRYSAVRCWSFQSAGDKFLIVPVISSSGQDVFLPPATSSGLSIWCDLLRSNLSIPPRPINIISRIELLSNQLLGHYYSTEKFLFCWSLKFDSQHGSAAHSDRTVPHETRTREQLSAIKSNIK